MDSKPVGSRRRLVYLAGPIDGCSDEEVMGWRETAKARLCHPTLDPMARDCRGREAEAMAFIVEGDKADIDRAWALLVWHPRPSTGTDMEVIYSWERGKVVAAVVPDGARVSPWLRYHSHAIFATLDEAIAWLNGWLP